MFVFHNIVSKIFALVVRSASALTLKHENMKKRD